jgi:hypothetical protein
MKDIVRRVKELIEATEPDITVVELGSSESVRLSPSRRYYGWNDCNDL